MNQRFIDFRNNKFVSSIADEKKWTVSTNNKVPIDMFIYRYRNGAIKGAKFTDELSLVDLDTLNSLIPNAANYAFYLDSVIDDFCVLDIEPKCPNSIKKQLIQMPCLYAETSMSGKGIHMVFRVPNDVFDDYPDARQKVAFKEVHGYYEILLNHYVTFTGKQIPFTEAEDDGSFKKVFTELAAEQKASIRADINFEILETVNTKFKSVILTTLSEFSEKYKKTLADFHGDHSKYEFGFTSYLYIRLENVLKDKTISQEREYNESEKAWFLYQILLAKLPKRPKHEEFRNGMPWLLYLATDVIAKSQPMEESEAKSNDG